MRAAAGELDDGGPTSAEAPVAIPVVEQLPSDAEPVEVVDGGTVGVSDDQVAAALGNPFDVGQPREVRGHPAPQGSR